MYALSKRLQQIYPHKFGQGKYFCIFGGLHIEKLLLKSHRQLIAGTGLPRSVSELFKTFNCWCWKYGVECP